MKNHVLSAISVAAALFVGACTESSTMGTDPSLSDNVLLADWTGPFGGIPTFDRMDLDALTPALEAGMAEAAS